MLSGQHNNEIREITKQVTNICWANVCFPTILILHRLLKCGEESVIKDENHEAALQKKNLLNLRIGDSWQARADDACLIIHLLVPLILSSQTSVICTSKQIKYSNKPEWMGEFRLIVANAWRCCVVIMMRGRNFKSRKKPIVPTKCVHTDAAGASVCTALSNLVFLLYSPAYITFQVVHREPVSCYENNF